MIITNVRIIDENQDRLGSLLLKNGRIERILEEQDLKGKEEPVLDGEGLALMPSFIDLHAHMRQPGYEYKEGLESGLSAALAGGFTHVCAMANTNPVTDSKEKVKALLDRSAEMDLAQLIQVSAVTRDFIDDANEMVDFEAIRPWTPIFSNDGKNMEDPKAMELALKASKEFDFVLSCHCEPEAEMVRRYIETAKKVGGNLHICHISTKETMELIRKAKEDGVSITCEVTPHHLFAWDDDYRVAPPIGSQEDVEALLQGIRDGVVDILATDHAPHTAQDKEKGMPGISNIEVAFSMYFSVFEKNGISIQRLSSMLSAKPARMLKLYTGTIDPGMEANLVLVDLTQEERIQPASFVSKGKNTPFAGRKTKGKIITTIKGGVVKYDHGQVVR